MKKIYSISAIVLVAGTLAAYLFGQIDGGTFTAVSTSIGVLLFGLYQKFEKGEVLKENLILKRDVEDIAESLYKERSLNQELTNRLYTENTKINESIPEVKKTRSKKVK